MAGCLLATARPSGAVEESQRFLDGLRERGLYDVALEYLQQMRSSPLATDDFKAVIDYQMAITLMDSSLTERQLAVRERQLADARAMFEKFLAEHPQHPLATRAKMILATLLVERGRIKVAQAALPDCPAEEKTALAKEARVLYRDAQKVLTGLERELLKRYKEFGLVDPQDSKRKEEKEQVQGDLRQVRLDLAGVVYEIGMAYDPVARKESRVENLKDAAAKYHALYEKYESSGAGYHARLGEGRCYKELGETEKAFAAFEEVLSQLDPAGPFRLIRSKALVLLLETALLPDVKQYEKAVEKAREWEKSAVGREATSSEGLAIKYLAGEAALECARSLKGEQEAKARAEYLKEAKQCFTLVAREPGEYQKQARSALRSEEVVGEDYVPPEPTDFAGARDRAADALDRSQRTDLKPAEIAAARREAIKYYRLAISMKTPELSEEDLNVIRYYLAYLYWASGDLYEAAILGEFLARHYPNSVAARQGANLAMQAYRKLAREGPRDERQFAAQRMTDIAGYITELWKGEPAADEAWIVLISDALDNAELQKAQAYLDKIPADSPRRGLAELMTGEKLWEAYLRAAAKKDDERPPQAELDEMVQQARQTLEDGIARMRKPVDQGAEISPTLANSVLSLARIYIGAAEGAKAVAWLEDPKIGALTLVENGNPAANRRDFRVATYKAALRAYVATQQVEKAEKTMAALEKLVQEDGNAQDKGELTRVYISLGRELQEQLERLRNERKTDQLKEVSEGFQRFLERISQREEGNTFNSLYWVAETFLGLAAGFDPNGKPLPPQAELYYRKAAETYEKLLSLCAAGKIEAPPGATAAVEIRRARCLRRLGQYKEALSALLTVLKVRDTIVDAQVEAAYTYQAWGAEKPGYYGLAIKGSTKYKQIWGWGKTARMVASSEKHRSLFHEARYNLALCRLKWALTRPKKERAAMLEQAEKDILVVRQLYPNLGEGLYLEPGGKDWKQKYEELLARIQKLRAAGASQAQAKP